jgi:hypothetical protein
MKQEAQFLLDRLEEYDPEDEDHVRDFHGHVAPAIARLRNALADKPKLAPALDAAIQDEIEHGPKDIMK